MKFFGIIFVFVVLVAAEVTAQGPETEEKKVTPSNAPYKCEVDRDCPQGYGCHCDEFTKLCIDCKECKTKEQCREKYNNPDDKCTCVERLCVGCT